jgi:uncharacterized damage-inducible protein DinB
MTSEFQSDLSELKTDIQTSRKTLDSAVATIADLDRARRGGWSLRRILKHVIDSEWLYAILVSHLGGQQAPDRPQVSLDAADIANATHQLTTCRQALLTALDGASEDNFYEIQRLGHEEYSILSVLENVANHDREHAEQISKIVSA